MKLVQIGAGNIGRSFIGQLFSRAGWEVVFADVNSDLVRLLQKERRYRILIKDENPEEIWIENLRALDAADQDAVAREIAFADLVATAVGAYALPSVYPLIAAGLKRRLARKRPLDILICENVLRGAELFREGLKPLLPAGFPFDKMVGLIETSIGKMVPIMPEDVRRSDPLLLYAEAFNTLIVDRRGFLGPVPDVPGLDAKDNIAAYVDRKLFIHNLGHAAAAYIGHVVHPDAVFTWQVLDDREIQDAARQAMWESARALMLRYSYEFDEHNQSDHIEDLLRRFANQALGDTVHRVGRDLPRKLGPEERIIGALRLDQQEGVPAPYTTLTLACALLFRAPDEKGEPYPADAEIGARLAREGPERILRDVCRLDAADPFDAEVIESASKACRCLSRRPHAAWLARFSSLEFAAFDEPL
jgi:mannitol-1-phosphate 5-dehydrogenase